MDMYNILSRSLENPFLRHLPSGNETSTEIRYISPNIYFRILVKF